MDKLFETVRKLSTRQEQRAADRRIGHRQGAVRPGDPLQRPHAQQAVRGRQLRGHPRQPDRVGVVRLSPRCLHRGACATRSAISRRPTAARCFLDEISTLPMAVQSSLLRVLEERVVVPGGRHQPRPVECAASIAASNHDPEKMVGEGDFREDLLYRLNVVSLTFRRCGSTRGYPAAGAPLPGQYTRQLNKQVLGFSNAAMRAMLDHRWPGNVPEAGARDRAGGDLCRGPADRTGDLPFAAAKRRGSRRRPEGGDARVRAAAHLFACLPPLNWDKAEAAQHAGDSACRACTASSRNWTSRRE